MSDNYKTAKMFFDACEAGKGWESCKQYCHADATFSAQANALDGIGTLEDYTEWMKRLLTPIPDGRYELRFFAEDQERQCVAAYAIFFGTHTGPDGPIEPTGKSVSADYVYAIRFRDGRIHHMTKIWNDAISLTQLGWA